MCEDVVVDNVIEEIKRVKETYDMKIAIGGV